MSYFNPRSSCEERPESSHALSMWDGFQSTLLMRGATIARKTGKTYNTLFQSTLLMRGATADSLQECALLRISIHAPHARSDFVLCGNGHTIEISIHAPHARSDLLNWQLPITSLWHFNPRSSCEERLCYFQALICLTSSYIFREPLTSFRKHFF